MKRDVLAMALITVLILSTLATVGMCYMYLKKAREVREQQNALNNVNRGIARNRQVLQALAIDLNTYARRNPAIIPLLQQMNLRIDSPATNSPSPARQ